MKSGAAPKQAWLRQWMARRHIPGTVFARPIERARGWFLAVEDRTERHDPPTRPTRLEAFEVALQSPAVSCVDRKTPCFPCDITSSRNCCQATTTHTCMTDKQRRGLAGTQVNCEVVIYLGDGRTIALAGETN